MTSFPEIAAGAFLIWLALLWLFLAGWRRWQERDKPRRGIEHPERLAVHVGNASHLRRLER